MVRRREKERSRTKTDSRSSRSSQKASSKKKLVDAEEAKAVVVGNQSVPSLGFLQCAENFEINDGSIASIGGDSFSAGRDICVTFNISPASTSCSSVNIPFDIGKQNKRELRESEPELPEETPSTSTSSSAQSKRSTSNSSWRHEHIDVYTESPMLPPIQRSCDTYRRHLVTKGRGIPLWIPEPNKRLPLQYQRKGVSLGDVGIVTASGRFMFLFNIYLAKDHPINPSVMPKGFEPMRSGAEIMGLPTGPQKEFKNNSYLASALIVKTRKDGDLTRLFFESSERDGAILTMPDGASSEDLANTARLWKYANKNLKSWYQYAYHDREIDVRNGDLKVVSGCDKTSAWGMATFFNSGGGFGPGSSSSPGPHSDSVSGGGGEPKVLLEFGLIGHVDDRTGEGGTKTYGWDCSGLADVRSGPDDCELLELRGGEEEEGVVYDNQCLFVRTLNLTFPMKVWEELGLREEEGEEDGPHENSTSRDGKNCALPSSSSSGGEGSAATFSSSSTSRGSTRSSTHKEEIIVDEHNAGPVYSPLMSLTDHPSIAINDLLLKNCSNDITMAVTLDQDWISVLKEDDFVLPSSDKLLERIMDTYTIREEDGVVFLHSKCVVEGQNGPLNSAIPSASVDTGKPGQIVDCSPPFPGLSLPLTVPEQYLRKTTGILDISLSNSNSFPHYRPYVNRSSGFTYRPSYPSRRNAYHPYVPDGDGRFSPDYDPSTSSRPSDVDGMFSPTYGPSTSSRSSGFSVGSSGDPGGIAHKQSQTSWSRPSHGETERYLRKTMGIPEPLPLNLYSLPDNPDDMKKPSVTDLARLAIWGSREKRLTLQQIYEAIEERYPSWKASKDKPWRRSIRHNLSLKAIFKHEERPNDHPGKGKYWVLNVRHGEATKRPRLREESVQSRPQGSGSEFSEDKGTPSPPTTKSTSTCGEVPVTVEQGGGFR